MRHLLLTLAALLLASPAHAEDKKPAPAKAAPAKAGKPAVEATWWGHAAWIIKTPGGATIAIDPWLKNPKAPEGAAWPEQLDAILVTHGHSDHVGDAAELAKKTNAQVICAFELGILIGAQNTNGLNVGGTVKIKDVTIHAVPAVHSSGFGADPKTPPAYGGPAMGYVLAVDNGPVLYHAGDTDTFTDMSLIADRYHPTVALLPIGGHFTMDPVGAALAAKLLRVKTVVPMHFGTFPALAGNPEELRTELKRGKIPAQVSEAKPGETLKL